MNPSVRNEILQMLADGKITAAEAIELLDQSPAKPAGQKSDIEPVDSLKAKEASPIPTEPFKLKASEMKAAAERQAEPYDGITITEDDVDGSAVTPAKNGERPRWLKIRVHDLSSGQNKVTVSLPISLVNFGLGVARRFGVDFEEADHVEEIWQSIKDGERGVIVDVRDEEDNEHVQIYLD